VVPGEPIEKTQLPCSGGRADTGRNDGKNRAFNDKTHKKMVYESAGSVDKKFEYGWKVNGILEIEATIMPLKQEKGYCLRVCICYGGNREI